MEANKTKINFFKKIWYSITKFEKYIEFKEERVKESTKYLVALLTIMALIISIFPTYSAYKFLSDGVKYIQNNVPDFKYESGTLIVDSEEPIKIDNNFVKAISNGYNLVIDTNLEDEEKVQEYVESIEGNKKAVLLKNRIITFENDEKTSEYEYQGAINSFLKYERTEFNKEDVINYFRTPMYYYYINNFTSYLFSFIVTFIIIAALIAIIGFAYAKIIKNDLKYKEIYSISCYASTLPIILYLIYMVLNYIIGVQIKYFDIIYILITFIYVLTAIKLLEDKN